MEIIHQIEEIDVYLNLFDTSKKINNSAEYDDIPRKSINLKETFIDTFWDIWGKKRR